MPEVRKLVTGGIYALLSNVSTGFNAQYAQAKQLYAAAEPAEIDWSPGVGLAPANLPENFFLGELDEAQLEASGLQRFPAVNLFTTEIDGAPTERREKFRKFSGTVGVGLVFYLKHRDGIELDGTVEDTCSCIDDAVLEVMNLWPSGTVVWNGDYKSGKPQLRLTGNGYVVRFPIEMTFEVNV